PGRQPRAGGPDLRIGPAGPAVLRCGAGALLALHPDAVHGGGVGGLHPVAVLRLLHRPRAGRVGAPRPGPRVRRADLGRGGRRGPGGPRPDGPGHPGRLGTGLDRAGRRAAPLGAGRLPRPDRAPARPARAGRPAAGPVRGARLGRRAGAGAAPGPAAAGLQPALPAGRGGAGRARRRGAAGARPGRGGRPRAAPARALLRGAGDGRRCPRIRLRKTLVEEGGHFAISCGRQDLRVKQLTFPGESADHGAPHNADCNGQGAMSTNAEKAAARDDVQRLSDAARDHLWMHFTRHSPYENGAKVPVITKGEGVHIWDAEGRRYIDGLGGLFVVQAGHGRRDIAEAATRQASELAYFPLWSYAHPAAIELAERLSTYTPGDLNRVFFTNSGSEAVETAWKLAKQYFALTGRPEKRKVISRSVAYHGTTQGALSITGVPDLKKVFEPLVPGTFKVANTNLYRADEITGVPGMSEDPEAFGRWAAHQVELAILAEGPETVAAVFLEPVQNSGGCFPPPP